MYIVFIVNKWLMGAHNRAIEMLIFVGEHFKTFSLSDPAGFDFNR